MWRTAGLLICFSCPMAMAEPVDLLTRDGYVALSGELVGVSDNFYVLETSVGEVKVPVSDVICRGEDCPVGTTSSYSQTPLKFTSDEKKKLPPEQKEKLFKQYLKWKNDGENSNNSNDELVVNRPIWEKRKTNTD